MVGVNLGVVQVSWIRKVSTDEGADLGFKVIAFWTGDNLPNPSLLLPFDASAGPI